MKISLTQDKFATVGPKDYVYLMQWKWYYSAYGYAVRNIWINNKCYTISMHRVILERMDYKNFARSDHINRDRLDNRRCNLRPATNHQSCCNQNKQKNNSSGYIGVSWDKCKRKWHVTIQVSRKRKFLGLYDDLEKAVRVRDKAVLKYHGEFAVLNET